MDYPHILDGNSSPVFNMMTVNVNGIIEQRKIDHIEVWISDGDEYKVIATAKSPVLYDLEICTHDKHGNCFIRSPYCPVSIDSDRGE